LERRTQRDDVLAAVVGAAAVETRLATDEGVSETRRKQRILCGKGGIFEVAVEVEQADVVLELALVDVAPDGEAVFTTDLFRPGGPK